MIKISDLSRKWQVKNGEVVGELGEVYICCGEHLGVFLNSRVGKKKATGYGWIRMQNGDYESTFKLPLADLDRAAKLIRAKRLF